MTPFTQPFSSGRDSRVGDNPRDVGRGGRLCLCPCDHDRRLVERDNPSAAAGYFQAIVSAAASEIEIALLGQNFEMFNQTSGQKGIGPSSGIVKRPDFIEACHLRENSPHGFIARV